MAYPSTSNPITEFLINGVWTDFSSKVRQEGGDQGVTITRGRQNEQGRVGPATSQFRVNNRDGLFSNRNPSSTYYGLLPRGTQVRHSAGTGTGDCHMRTPYDDQLNNNYATTPDKAVLDIVGDIEVRVDVWPHTWRPGNSTTGSTGGMILAAKYNTAANRSWVLYLKASGLLSFRWSTDGATGITVNSTVPVPASSGRLSVKVTLDVDNGAAGNTVTFYTASSITGTYTQLGSAVVTGGVTSIYASLADLLAGAGQPNGVFTGFTPFGGKYYGLRVYNGIGGTEVARFDPTSRSVGDTTWSDGLGTPNTWTFLGSARITSDRVRFWGELASAPQYWDKSATDVYVPMEAGGLIRRLTQGASPLRSPIYRQFLQLPGVTDYWPMEDGTNSTTIANVATGGAAAKVNAVTFASDSTLPGSSPAVQFSSTASTIIATPTRATTTGTLSYVLYLKVPSTPAITRTFLTLFTTGTARRIEVGMDSANWYITFWDITGTALDTVTTPFTSFTTPATGQWVAINLLLTTSGGNVNWYMRWLVAGAATFSGIGPRAYAGTVGRFTQINIKASGETAYNGANFAHMLISTSDINFVNSTVYNATNAYTGETAAARIARLAAEEGISVQIDGFYNQTATMGYQTAATFIDLVYECADADMGVLCDARDALAISYRTRLDLELHRDATLTMTSSHLAEVPLPTEDDQSLVNDMTVERTGGSSARYVKTTGSLGTANPPTGAGVRDSSTSLNLSSDTILYDRAGWLVHLGTWDEARFPSLTVGMHRSQITASSTLSEQCRVLDVGNTVTLAGMPSWMPPDSVPLLVQGYTETLLKSQWTITYNTTPAGPYNTARYDYDDAAGTPRYDTSGSTLNTNINSSATTIILNYANAGDNWTTSVGSYPFNIKMGGEVITLNSPPAGTTSPQTFTGCTRSVNGVVKSHTAGEAVTLADTRYYTM